jgi:hypothetical protein
MFYFDLAIALAVVLSFRKSNVVFSDGLGICLMFFGLFALSHLMGYMGLEYTGMALFGMAFVNAFLGLTLRARRKAVEETSCSKEV